MADTKENYRNELKRSLNQMVDDILESGAVTDYSPAAQQTTIYAMRNAAQNATQINDRIGPFYSTNKVQALLGDISRQAVSERARNHRLLRLTTSDNVHIYPTFQFNVAQKSVRHKLIPLLRVLLGSGADPWATAYWLTTPLPKFDHKTALEAVETSDSARTELFNMAVEDAERWQSAGNAQQAS